MTVSAWSAGRLIVAPSPDPPGAGTEVGIPASRLWSPTIQNVDPGRTFSTRARSIVFFLNGVSPRDRLPIAASTSARGPKRSAVSSRKARATDRASSSLKTYTEMPATLWPVTLPSVSSARPIL